MRLIVLTLFAAASIGAADVAPVAPEDGSASAAVSEATEVMPALAMHPCIGSIPVFNPQACPPPALFVDGAQPPVPANCKDRIQQVRDTSGQPALDKRPASPNEGYMINAVDMRVDGCAVMQMKGNVNDLRPLPEDSGPARLQPAH